MAYDMLYYGRDDVIADYALRWAKKAFLQERPIGLCLSCMKEHPAEPEATDAECPACGLHRLQGCAAIVMSSSADEYPDF